MASDTRKSDVILKACRAGDANKLNKLLKTLSKEEVSKIPLEIQLHHACVKSSNIECLQLVINKFGLDLVELNSTNDSGFTPLHLAIMKRKHDMIRFLIELGADVNLGDDEGHTPLYFAVGSSQAEATKLLLDAGAEISHKDQYGASTLHYASQECVEDNPKLSDTLKSLVSYAKDSDLNCKDLEGRSPLIWASSAGSKKAARILLDAGADADLKDSSGLTALHCAASHGHSDILESLVSTSGKSVDITDKYGCTPLFYAVSHNQREAVTVLLNVGANPNHQDVRGRSVMHCAASKGFTDILNELREKGGNLWLTCNKQQYPLHEAIDNNHPESALHLLDSSDSTTAIMRPRADGQTALHLAAKMGDEVLLNSIVDRTKDDINVVCVTKKGEMTALDICNERGYQVCANLLKQHGCKPAKSVTDAKCDDEPDPPQPASSSNSPKHVATSSPMQRNNSNSPKQQTNSNSPKQQTNSNSPKQQTNSNSPKQQTNSNSPKQQTNSTSPAQQTNSNSPKQQTNSNSPKQQTNSTSPKQEINSNSPKQQTTSSSSVQQNSTQQTSSHSPAQENSTTSSIQQTSFKTSPYQASCNDPPQNDNKPVKNANTVQQDKRGQSAEGKGNKKSQSVEQVTAGVEGGRKGSRKPNKDQQSTSSQESTTPNLLDKRNSSAKSNPYEYAMLPYSKARTTSFVNVSSLVKRPKTSQSHPQNSKINSVREKIQSSIDNYNAVRKSARLIRDKYYKQPRPPSSQPVSVTDQSNQLYNETTSDYQRPTYTVLVTRGGFTKVPNHPEKCATNKVVIRSTTDRINVLYRSYGVLRSQSILISLAKKRKSAKSLKKSPGLTKTI